MSDAVTDFWCSRAWRHDENELLGPATLWLFAAATVTYHCMNCEEEKKRTQKQISKAWLHIQEVWKCCVRVTRAVPVNPQTRAANQLLQTRRWNDSAKMGRRRPHHLILAPPNYFHCGGGESGGRLPVDGDIHGMWKDNIFCLCYLCRAGRIVAIFPDGTHAFVMPADDSEWKWWNDFGSALWSFLFPLSPSLPPFRPSHFAPAHFPGESWASNTAANPVWDYYSNIMFTLELWSCFFCR